VTAGPIATQSPRGKEAAANGAGAAERAPKKRMLIISTSISELA
jgi:hypothetical protein